MNSMNCNCNFNCLVGVVGLTLGGGRGWTSHLYGLAADQLLDMTIVLANGTIINANFTHNKVLFIL